MGTIKAKQLADLLMEDPEAEVHINLNYWHCEDGCSGYEESISTKDIESVAYDKTSSGKTIITIECQE